MRRILSVALLIGAAVLVSACAKKHDVIDPPNAGTQVPANGAEGASTSSRALGSNASTEGNGMGADAQGPLAKRVIYFRLRQIGDQTRVRRDRRVSRPQSVQPSELARQARGQHR